MPRAAWTPAQAVRWLEQQHNRPSKSYRGLCAHLASRAFGFDGAGQNANQWAWSIPKRLRHYSGVAPKGGLYFWPQGQYGHVAVSYGNGRVICNDANGGVSVIPASFYWGGIGQGGGFWVHPDDLGPKSVVFRACFGVNPDGPAPVIRPRDPVVARPGRRSASVPAIRHALGGRSKSTFYGETLRRKVSKWQTVHKVKPTGVVTKSQAARIVAGR